MPLLEKHEKHKVSIILNGRKIEGMARPNMLLSDFLRAELGATGTHVGCEHGVCGACTIRVDGKAVRSCLYLAVQAQGRRVDTIEGLAEKDGSLGVLQTAFHKNFALQCGFCTPGFLMTLDNYLEDNSDPTEADLREALSGNMCRCTGYAEIIKAALSAAAEFRKRK
ncbi:(2Fe-2S)-binding protein [Leisingera daeponensis]|uniref:(2Fe-2S)-binding protein n=1 Tax=Leisingera daeponensis TaxID=405746 RepID=UPI001C958D5D|nr:(2Fe-2S)-binding protein [Leisingera daeponensis]MBY6058776.1 (2Fe-2S)-binding protein [Leisingera daeponensis]